MSLITAWSALFSAYAHAYAACDPGPAVLQVQLPSAVRAPDAPVSTGEWYLPMSPQVPTRMTYARLKVTLFPPDDTRKNWSAHIQMSFPDPKPFGLPYAAYRLVLSWQTTQGMNSATKDWTSDCMDAGRSLFPGQTWSEVWDVGATEGLSALSDPSISFWGSRN